MANERTRMDEVAARLGIEARSPEELETPEEWAKRVGARRQNRLLALLRR